LDDHDPALDSSNCNGTVAQHVLDWIYVGGVGGVFGRSLGVAMRDNMSRGEKSSGDELMSEVVLEIDGL
jgi:hypothetical protein